MADGVRSSATAEGGEARGASLEEREYLVRDAENVSEHGMSLSEDYWIFVHHKGQRSSKKIGRDKRFALKVAREIDGRLKENDLSICGGPIPALRGIR